MWSDGLIVIVLSSIALLLAMQNDSSVVRWAAVAFTWCLIGMFAWKIKRGEYN